MVRKRRGRKRALGTRTPMPVPAGPNGLWVLDFVTDQLVSGRRFRILAIFDVCTRRCLAAIADFSLSGKRVARELDLLIADHGKPKAIGSDNGTELTSNAILTGRPTAKSTGTTSTRASRCKTPSSKASTAGCATSS
jgi:transposase InsO family protein